MEEEKMVIDTRSVQWTESTHRPIYKFSTSTIYDTVLRTIALVVVVIAVVVLVDIIHARK